MIYALRRDVVDASGVPLNKGGAAEAGKVRLRSDKRPRPICIRMNVGDTLVVNFQNLLSPVPPSNGAHFTRTASVHAMGMQLVNSILDDGSNVGRIASPGGLAAPGDTVTYTFYAEKEGAFLLYSSAALAGGEQETGTLDSGLFGAVNVQPAGAEWYRSQITEEELSLATLRNTMYGHPVVD